MGALPVFWTVAITWEVSVRSRFVIVACSVFPMRPKMEPLIHAATTTLTATVTAISMIDATTGLRAFVFLLYFLIIFWVFILFPFTVL